VKDKLYYVVDINSVEMAHVRDSTMSEDCFEVRYGDRDWYSAVNKRSFLTTASTDENIARKMFITQLRAEKARLEKRIVEADRKIDQLTRLQGRLPDVLS